eukprot:scpid13498/ scgid5807/ Delphilin; Glutamate receptor, ionotropic, delta 2-interacting protein 1
MSNAGWPEAFGFSIGGGRPALITAVRKGSAGQIAGLLVGDMISELDEQDVQQCSCEELKMLAHHSRRVPPALNVISRIITIEIPRRKNTPLGFTLRGDGPLYVRSVEVNGLARNAGMRSGDMLLQVDGVGVEQMMKSTVQRLIEEGTSPFLRLVLISSGLEPLPKTFSMTRPADRYEKANIFYEQMDFYLMGEDAHKSNLRNAMKDYANDKRVDKLGRSLQQILTTRTQRRLLKYIRDFVPERSQPQFDVLVSMDSDIILGDRHRRPQSVAPSGSSQSLAAGDLSRVLSSSNSSLSRERSSSDPRRQAPNMGARQRRVQVHRGAHGFGMTLRGNADQPLFISAVDPGGPAHGAGLQPGDKLLEINGLDVRKFEYKRALELLAGSGSRPVLLISSPARSAPASNRVRAQSVHAGQPHGQMSRSSSIESSRSSRPHSAMPDTQVREQFREFKMQMESMLSKSDCDRVKAFLAQYNKDKKMEDLVHKLIALLKKQPQLQLLHNVCQLLPQNKQEEFDRTAAAALARLARAIRGARGSESGENMQDLMYRVQATPSPGGAVKTHRYVGGNPSAGGGSGSRSGHPRMHPVPGGEGELVRVPAGMKLVPQQAVILKDGQRVVAARTGARTRGQPSNQTGGGGGSSGGMFAAVADLAEGDYDYDDDELESNGYDLNQPKSLDSPITRRVRAGTNTDYDAQIAEAKAAGEETAKVKLRERSKKLNESQSKKMAVKRSSLLGSNLENLASGTSGHKSPSPSPLAVGSPPPPPPPPPPSAMSGGIPPPPPMGPNGIPLPPPLGPDGIPIPPPLMFGPDGIPLPPPLGPGGIPLLPGMAAANQKKLKHLNWDKLGNTSVEGTIWADTEMVDQGLMDTLEHTEVEEIFAAQDSSKAGLKGNKKKERNLIDSRKALNISILLGHLKLSNEEIKHAVLQLDTETLSEQHLRVMKDFAPDEKELASLQAYAGKLDKFSKADQFAFELSTIPKYTERLNALLFKMHFSSKVDEIKPDLEAIITAARQLRNCVGLKAVLKMILQIGNTLNQGNARIGHATGFKISFLGKLEATRTTDNKSNLLQFVVKKACEKQQGTRFLEELDGLAGAARVSSQTLREEVHEIKTQLDRIKEDVLETSMMAEQLDGDRFQEVMDDFLVVATVKMDELNRLYTTMEKEFNEVVNYFGEDPKKTRSDEFFVIFSEFIQNFRRASIELERAREAEEARQKRDEAREERKRMLAERGKTTSAVLRSAPETDGDIVDFRKRLRPAKNSPSTVRGEIYGDGRAADSADDIDSDGQPAPRLHSIPHGFDDADDDDESDADRQHIRQRQQAPRRSAAAAAAAAMQQQLARSTHEATDSDSSRQRPAPLARQPHVQHVYQDDDDSSFGDQLERLQDRGYDAEDDDDLVVQSGFADPYSGEQSFF